MGKVRKVQKKLKVVIKVHKTVVTHVKRATKVCVKAKACPCRLVKKYKNQAMRLRKQLAKLKKGKKPAHKKAAKKPAAKKAAAKKPVAKKAAPKKPAAKKAAAKPAPKKK